MVPNYSVAYHIDKNNKIKFLEATVIEMIIKNYFLFFIISYFITLIQYTMLCSGGIL